MMSVAIMGHPARIRFIQWLVDRLVKERNESGMIPEVQLVLDEKRDRWDTGRRSLLAYDARASHHLVIQDDALPCRDILSGAQRAAKAARDHPVSLYTGRLRPHRSTVAPIVRYALEHGRTWFRMPGPWWGVAIIIPTKHIPELVAWGDQHPEIPNYDRRIEAWYQTKGLDCFYTIPSLVDHRSVYSSPSLIPGRTGNRQAYHFLGLNESANKLSWHRRPLSPYKVLPAGSVLSYETPPEIQPPPVPVLSPAPLPPPPPGPLPPPPPNPFWKPLSTPEPA